MTEAENFAETLMEGIRLSDNPRYDTTTYNLAVILHSTREKVKKLEARIADIDTVFSDASIMVKCRSCGNDYDLPCDVSEFNPDYSYCGGSDRCLP